MTDREQTWQGVGLECWCCYRVHEKRDPATDPWEGRLNGYCDDCATTRCDTSYSICSVRAMRNGHGAVTDREQTRRLATECISYTDEYGAGSWDRFLADACLALLTELGQAERERDDLFHALTRVTT